MPTAVETFTSINARQIANIEGKILKTKTRSFTVEIKGSRRRLAARPRSIWGDTDLKAIARKAEVDDPQLFKTAGREEPTPSETKPTAEPYAGEPLVASASDCPSKTTADYPDQQRPELIAEPAQLTAEAHFEAEATPETAEVKTSARRQKGGPKRRAKSAKAATQPDVVPQQSTDGEELDELERENLALKHLLAEHLRAENAELEAMLARFSS